MTRTHSAQSSSKQGFKLAAAVAVPVLVAAALVGLLAASGDDGISTDPSTTTTATATREAKAFQTKADDAFRPLADAITSFLPKAQEFELGTVNPSEFKAAVDMALPELMKVRDAVGTIDSYTPAPAVNRYFFAAAALYLETGRVYRVAAETDAEPLRQQLNMAARRLRTLADRIYDRGRVVLDPAFYRRSPQVEFRPPPEVPDWAAEGLAAGPPLAAPPGPPSAAPPVREETCGAGVSPPCRPEESAEDWVNRVKDARFPQPSEVARAMEPASAAKLGELAAAYQTMTRTLRAGRDPKGGREKAAVVGLGFLVAGEAARLGQAAALLPAGEARTRLLAAARRVLVVSDGVLEPSGLGFRSSGLPRSILSDTGS